MPKDQKRQLDLLASGVATGDPEEEG
jgi:hypothetical protein